MLKAKDIHKTEAYRQLREAVVKAVPAALRRTQLALLTRRFLTRCTEQGLERLPNDDELTVDSAMIWADTAEGHGFWRCIHDSWVDGDFDLNPCPIKKPKPRVRAVRPVPQEVPALAARRPIPAVDGLFVPDAVPAFMHLGAAEMHVEEARPAVAVKKIGWW